MSNIKVNPVSVASAALLLSLGLAMILNWEAVKPPLISACYKVLVESLCESDLRSIVASVLWALCILPLILLVEVFRRAKPAQPLISIGLIQDFVWFSLLLFFTTILLTQYDQLLNSSFQAYFPVFKIEIIAALPVPVQVIAVIIVSDFIGWFDHWVRHKIGFLWEFHKVHHAPRQLNFFTNSRLHPFDYLAIATIGIPFLALDLDVAVPAFAGWILFKEVHLYFIHGNIKTNLGPLRYLITTPQSHRVHHSIERQHADRNFAVHFVIWDFLFGTQWRQWDEYPDTGVDDPAFPLEKSAKPLDLLKTVWRQFIYPFQAIYRKIATH